MWTPDEIQAAKEHALKLQANAGKYERKAAELVNALANCETATTEEEQKAKRQEVLEVLYKLGQLEYKQNDLYKGFKLFRRVDFYAYDLA